MQYRQLLAFGSHALFSTLITLLAISLSSCTDEKDEPRKPSSSNDNNSVVINSDGTATGGAVFSRLDGETFFLDYVKYKVVDAHLEIIDYDRQELPAEPKLYAEVTLDGTLYKTRSISPHTTYDTVIGAFKNAKITSVVIPATVTVIDYHSFRGCSSLTTVAIPEGVTDMGEYCFYGCSSLTSVTLPESLKYLGPCSFYGCDSLAEVTFKSDVPDGAYSLFTSMPVAYVPMQYLQNYNDSDIARYFSAIIGY